MVAAIAILLAGWPRRRRRSVVPSFVTGVGRAATAFVDQHGYVAQAVTSTTVQPASLSIGWTTSGIVLGLVAAALAVLAALAAVYGPRCLACTSCIPGTSATMRWLVFGSDALAGLLIV